MLALLLPINATNEKPPWKQVDQSPHTDEPATLFDISDILTQLLFALHKLSNIHSNAAGLKDSKFASGFSTEQMVGVLLQHDSSQSARQQAKHRELC